jgi:hypothetical protein
VPKAAKIDRMQRLTSLAETPEAQLEYALTLIAGESRQDVLEVALEVLGGASHDPRVRPAILAAYEQCLTTPSRADAGCYRRVALLRTLRPVVRREDVPLLARAASTCEFLPPGRSEMAAGLRSTALVIMNEVDEQFAAYHAVRLLTDQHTSELSGEPAITAAQTLASQGQWLPLYGVVVRTDAVMPEVVAECLRHLVGVPVSILEPLVARYIKSPHEIVLLGLLELLLDHPERQVFEPLVLEFMRETKLVDLYRWLVNAALTSRRPALIAAVTAMESAESDPRKAAILHEALALR